MKKHPHSNLSIKAIMISLLSFLSLSVLNSLSSSSSFSFPFFFIQSVSAKEIEATNEWQLLEEGDTIPAGLHVRMDLETGKKWVKLMEEGEEQEQKVTKVESTALSAVDVNVDVDIDVALDSNSDEQKHSNKDTTTTTTTTTKITHLTNTQVDPQKSAKITSQLLEQAKLESQRKANLKQSIAALNDFHSDTTIDELDYEMMYRTLKSLPDEDLELMDVPKHPFENDNGQIDKEVDMDNEENVQKLNTFIERIKEIWKGRQEVLKKLEEEYIANVPDIIQERIVALKEYISSPLEQLKALILQEQQEEEEDKNDESKPMNILETLEDLEFHLMDIDMARDFHIMGGWPLLVSLLTDDIHFFHLAMEEVIRTENITTSTTSIQINDESIVTIQLSKEKQDYLDQIQQMIWKVQSLASWSIGTAVKNVEEFHPWALEDMSSLLQQTNQQQSSSADSNVNVLSILLSKIEKDSNFYSNRSDSSQWLKLKQKQMYALGSILRGNKFATSYFDAMNGPSILGTFFHTLIEKSNAGDDGYDVLNKPHGIKLLSKVMMLGVDLLKDTKNSSASLEEEGREPNYPDIVSNLSNNDTWCIMPWILLQHVGQQQQQSKVVQDQIIEAMVELSSHCDYTSYKEDLEKYVQQQHNDDPELVSMINSIQLGQ